MLKALGVRMFSGDEIKAKGITSYEEVIRTFPGLRIENGNLVNFGSKASLNYRHAGLVELWVDGVRWQSSSGAGVVPIAGMFNPNQMGGMPKALPTYTPDLGNTFTEFSSLYPIHLMEKIAYYRPSTALIISNSAAMGAGALVMTTKDGSKIKDWDKDLFVKCVTPKGYQKVAESYKPHFEYDPVGTEYVISSAWYPAYNGVDSLPSIENSEIVVDGITNEGLPVHLTTKR